MPNLYPAFDVPAIVSRQTTGPKVKYGTSFAFDFSTGDFQVDGAGRVPGLSGYAAWVAWCVKAVLTERYSALIYSKGYGAEIERARRHSNREATELEIERAITEALLTDRRTKAVQEFAFSWAGDQLSISITIIPTIGTAERLEVSLSG